METTTVRTLAQVQNTSSALSDAEQSNASEQRSAALGRHTVKQLNVSNSELAFAGAVGGAVITTAASTLTDCPWSVVALSGAAGAAVFALSQLATARPMTPLQHAQSELDQIRATKDSLMKTRIDRADYECDGYEIRTFIKLAEKYNEPWRVLDLLWTGAFAPKIRDNTEAFMTEFYEVLRDKFHVTGTDPIKQVVIEMVQAGTLEKAKELPQFKHLLEEQGVKTELHDELATMMFMCGRAFIGDEDFEGKYGKGKGVTAKTAYLEHCKECFAHFKNRLEQDEINLEKDVITLRAMRQEKLQGLTETSTEST